MDAKEERPFFAASPRPSKRLFVEPGIPLVRTKGAISSSSPPSTHHNDEPTGKDSVPPALPAAPPSTHAVRPKHPSQRHHSNQMLAIPEHTLKQQSVHCHKDKDKLDGPTNKNMYGFRQPDCPIKFCVQSTQDLANGFIGKPIPVPKMLPLIYTSVIEGVGLSPSKNQHREAFAIELRLWGCVPNLNMAVTTPTVYSGSDNRLYAVGPNNVDIYAHLPSGHTILLEIKRATYSESVLKQAWRHVQMNTRHLRMQGLRVDAAYIIFFQEIEDTTNSIWGIDI